METRSYKKNRFVIILVAIAGMSVYLLPYFRYYYYDAYVAYFGINDLQMGMLGSIYGALAIIGYCLGGWVADRVSLKLAISGSLIVTGASAIILLMKPVFPIHVAIYGLWGVTSILTFWNPSMKALRALCKPEEQGRGYALFDMVRGMLNFLTGLVVLAAYTAVANKIGEANGITGLITFYGAEAIIVGIIVYFALKKTLPDFLENKNKSQKNTSFAKNVLTTLKKPTTWCVVIMMFMTYGVIITYNYVVPYCTAAFGMSAALASIMGYAANGFRFCGCWIGGQIADRKGLSNMLLVDIILMIIGVLGLLFTPRSMNFMWMLVISIALLCSFMYSAQALHYAVLEEGDYPVEIMGATTFILSPIGYGIAESIMPMYNGWCLEHFKGLAGYEAIFKTFIVMLCIALISTLIFRKLTKERRLELARIRDKNTSAKSETQE